jgi:translation initiation factor 3 subunit A
MASKTKKAERDEEDKSRRDADQKRRLAEAALEKEKEEHRLNMKIAIDKLRESEIGRKTIELIGEEELYKYDPNSINSLHIDAVIRHSRELKEKLKVQFKKVDYLVRAQHEAEIPLLNKHAQQEMVQRNQIQLDERRRAIDKRDRLVRMEDDKNDFLQSIRGQRHDDYVTRMTEFKQRLAVERQQRLEQLRKEHVEQKKQEWKREKQMKQKKIEEEKNRKIAEEQKRVEEERLAQDRAVDDEKRRKQDEQARKQREKEEEVERKLQAGRTMIQTASQSASVDRRSAAPASNYSADKDRTDG